MRTPIVLVVIAVLACAFGSVVRAAGGPSANPDAGLTGIATPAGFRYVAIGEKNRTVLARIGPEGHVAAVRFLAGRFTIMGVAYDGTPTGLSFDGKTLVLIRPHYRFPRARTPFLILSAPTLHVRAAVTLRGNFSLDAISPDGRRLYFIQYLSPKDPTRYAVRAYDVQAGRLLPDPIIDRSRPDEQMRGNPVSRATSADGRWAYTLYDGGGMTPFVHALDTVGAEAHCIDLDELAGRDDLASLRLRLGEDGTLAVTNGREQVAVVDLSTLRAPEPARAPGGGIPWLLIAAAAGAVFAAAGASLVFLRRRRLAPT